MAFAVPLVKQKGHTISRGALSYWPKQCDVFLGVLREQLSEDAISHLKAEGREMSIDQAIDEILRVMEEPVS